MGDETNPSGAHKCAVCGFERFFAIEPDCDETAFGFDLERIPAPGWGWYILLELDRDLNWLGGDFLRLAIHHLEQVQLAVQHVGEHSIIVILVLDAPDQSLTLVHYPTHGF